MLFIVATLTFFILRVAPGGPFDKEKKVAPEILQKLNERYNLDKPLPQQYYIYFKKLILEGDLGPSFRFPGRTVNEIIATGFPISAQLGLFALLWALLIGLLSGVIASIRPNTISDYLPMSFSMIGICVPSFVLGPVLALIFGIKLEWLNISGWNEGKDKILPAIALGSMYAAYVARLSRGGMLEILSQDFIRTARAKGLNPDRPRNLAKSVTVE